MPVIHRVTAQTGYTLAELTIAMAIFSVVMVVITVTTVNLFHVYQAAIGTRNTQQAMRSVADEISGITRDSVSFAVKNSMLSTYHDVRQDVLCLYSSSNKDDMTAFYLRPPAGAVTGQYEMYKKHIHTDGVVVDCPANGHDSHLDNGVQLTSNLVSVLSFKAETEGATGELLNLHITTAGINGISDDDLTFPVGGDPQCSNQTTPQYCTITHVDTSLFPRERARDASL